LLHLNIQIDDEVYEEYIQKYFEMQRPEAIEIDDFIALFQLIMKNQSPYFRALYKRGGNEAGDKDIKPINFKII
jgi:hypothetical protein